LLTAAFAAPNQVNVNLAFDAWLLFSPIFNPAASDSIIANLHFGCLVSDFLPISTLTASVQVIANLPFGCFCFNFCKPSP
jgi:hypothetical protein